MFLNVDAGRQFSALLRFMIFWSFGNAAVVPATQVFFFQARSRQ